MSYRLKNFLEETRIEAQPELDRIKAYWDKKTLFVHRRALIAGVVCGIFLGMDFMFAIFYFLGLVPIK